MALTQNALQSILKSQTDLIFLECLDIVTPDETLRLVNDNVDLETERGVYQRFPFDTSTTAVTDNSAPKLKITADAVDQRLIREIRGVTASQDDVHVIYRVVTKQNPNDNQHPPTRFVLDTVNTDGYTGITLICLYFRGALNDTYPCMQISPASAGTR